MLLGPQGQQELGDQPCKPLGLVEPDVARNAQSHQQLGLVVAGLAVMDDQAIGGGTDGALPAVAGAAEAAGEGRGAAGAHGE